MYGKEDIKLWAGDCDDIIDDDTEDIVDTFLPGSRFFPAGQFRPKLRYDMQYY